MFALTLSGGFVFVALLAYWRKVEAVAAVALAIALIALLAAVAIPGRLDPARRTWMRFGEAIGRVTTPIILAIIYYGVITPTGLIRRAAGGRGRTRQDSTWHQRPPLPPAERMERQF